MPTISTTTVTTIVMKINLVMFISNTSSLEAFYLTAPLISSFGNTREIIIEIFLKINKKIFYVL